MADSERIECIDAVLDAYVDLGLDATTILAIICLIVKRGSDTDGADQRGS